MRFVDEAKLKVKAGDGGRGIVAWRREKFVPQGGPAGGDGGKGGDIIFVAQEGLSSLLDLKKETFIEAEAGRSGQSKNKTGRHGEDRIVLIPVGTSVFEVCPETNHKVLLKDFIGNDDFLSICQGGYGGLGNARFKSSSTHAPEKATPGAKGEEKELVLTLKLMADVGLLGFPNAGKSTLLRGLSNAKPKVADYPFTTIKPMVGVCEVEEAKSMVVADIPGLIEGASLGMGLGFRFLRHLERVRVLCHIIDIAEPTDLIEKYQIINKELKNYSEELYGLPQIIALNKIDSLGDDKFLCDFISFLKEKNINYYLVSAVTKKGLTDLKNALFSEVVKHAPHKDRTLKENNHFDPTKNLYA